MTTLAPDQTDEKSAHDVPGSLKAAGIAYLVGDAALAYAKHQEGKGDGVKGALIWAAGGIAAAIYGNPKAEKQLQLLQHRLGSYLKKQGVGIPSNPTTAELTKDGGIIEHIETFLYSHPSEMLNTAYAIGGALTLKDGIKDKKGKSNPWDVYSGALITAGALIGLLVPEKKFDSDHPPQGIMEKIQEKPLRVSGALYHLNNIAMIVGAWKQIAENKNTPRTSHWFRFLTAGSYIFANTMLALSSKENSSKDAKENTAIVQKLADVSAKVIAAQPKEVQEALVQNIAGYLSAQPEIKKTAPEIADLLHAKLAQTRQAMPLAGKWQQHVETGANPQLSPSF